uniref:C-type lectin domain-containing protein n=1 Tax=Acrobeloides nanus TaxID=290746 RepID=A0A914DGI5_9BILA
MEPSIFNFVFIFVLASVTVPTINAQTLAQACTALNNSTNLTTTFVDGNGLCNFFVRIPNMTYDATLDVCNTALSRAQTTCQVAMLANQSDVNTYIQRGLLRATDKFLIGLRRPNCTTNWAWEYYNGTKVPFSMPVGDIPNLPSQNVNCSSLYVGYTGSQFTPAGSDFSTDLLGCTCGVSNASVSTLSISTSTTMTSIPFTTTSISTTTTMTSSIPLTTTSISTTTTSAASNSTTAGGSSNANITTTSPKNLAISRNIMSSIFIIPCVLYVVY